MSSSSGGACFTVHRCPSAHIRGSHVKLCVCRRKLRYELGTGLQLKLASVAGSVPGAYEWEQQWSIDLQCNILIRAKQISCSGSDGLASAGTKSCIENNFQSLHRSLSTYCRPREILEYCPSECPSLHTSDAKDPSSEEYRSVNSFEGVLDTSPLQPARASPNPLEDCLASTSV